MPQAFFTLSCSEKMLTTLGLFFSSFTRLNDYFSLIFLAKEEAKKCNIYIYFQNPPCMYPRYLSWQATPCNSSPDMHWSKHGNFPAEAPETPRSPMISETTVKKQCNAWCKN